MFFGADYYPEHWTKERWPIDANLMKQAGINIVRLAEFAWAKLEPSEGEYDFSWLDKAIKVLKVEGIEVVLGTPTASPPKWLVDKYVDILQKDIYGRARGFGSRRHYCANNPIYQELSKKIVAKMAEHYKDNPSIITWQIDNEFGCQNTTYCYCESCLDAFRKWLQSKYTNIENLNQEWGTVFWSQTYTSFEEIILPAYTTCDESDMCNHGHNLGLLLDYNRFASDSIVNYQKLQIHEIRKVSQLPITHNMMGQFPEIDYFNLGKDLDFVSWDNYPNMQWGISNYKQVAMAHDLMRGIKNKNFWVMEQQSGPCGWSVLGDTPKPGQIRLWTFQSIAHGAEAIVYFRWRSCLFGTEEYWHGILDHDGIPRRRYHEIKQTGLELSALSELIVDSKNVSEVAIIKSYDNLWSHGFQKHNYQFDYSQLLSVYYDALTSNNIATDVTSLQNDLSRYKVVFLPAYSLMDEETKYKLENYVKNGGNLVISFRSGTKNWNNSMTEKTLPGEFKDLAGIEVYEFDSLNQGRRVQVSTTVSEGSASIWCDILKPVTASVIGTYSSEYYKGEAAITVNSFGSGKVYYIGCDLDQSCLNKLVSLITSNAGIMPILPEYTEGVEVVVKEKAGKQYLMILNHNSVEVKLDVVKCYKNLITGQIIDRFLILQPYDVAVLM